MKSSHLCWKEKQTEIYVPWKPINLQKFTKRMQSIFKIVKLYYVNPGHQFLCVISIQGISIMWRNGVPEVYIFQNFKTPAADWQRKFLPYIFVQQAVAYTTKIILFGATYTKWKFSQSTNITPKLQILPLN